MSWALKQQLMHVLSQEQGASIFAPGSREGFALIYPNLYQVGMSNLGLHIIYQIINSRKDTACERVFLPDKITRNEYIRTATPLMSLETQRPLYEFPLIGFSISFEMDYFNILDILALGKVPLKADERKDTDPIIIIGGPCATFNPEPIADFIDIAVIGEGEETIQHILDTYYEGKSKGLTRDDLLFSFTKIPGVYVPRFYQPIYNQAGLLQNVQPLNGVPSVIHRQWIKDLDQYLGHTVVVTPETEFKHMYLVEVARGCGRHCRFCMAGYCFRKPRARSLAKVLEAVDQANQYGYRVGLMGAAISDYPAIDALCNYLDDANIGTSVASLRADSLTKTLVNTLVKSNYRTITLAPEAGSERLRRVINKGITEQHLMDAVTKAVLAGIPNIRLYIMVGLPWETDADIQEIVNMTIAVKTKMIALGTRGKLTLSINPFIPKPFTPFQWLPMTKKTVVDQRLQYIKHQLKHIKGIEVLTESTKEAYIQGVLARGDRNLSKVLLSAHDNGGVKGWKSAVKKHNINEELYLYRERSLDELLPWSHLDMGISIEYLKQEFKQAIDEMITAPCIPNTKGCRRCGVCKEEVF